MGDIIFACCAPEVAIGTRELATDATGQRMIIGAATEDLPDLPKHEYSRKTSSGASRREYSPRPLGYYAR